MERQTTERLLALNLEFYESFGTEFARTRRKLNAGIERALWALDPLGDVLDLGCGDGRVARALADRAVHVPGTCRSYTGVDNSERLLGIARSTQPPAAAFLRADITVSGWAQTAGIAARRFDSILSFSVLQHIPSAALRRKHLTDVRDLLGPGGRLAVSVWSFLHLDRFRSRIVPWIDAGIDEHVVEPGDLLLDWREGGSGLRYVHHYTMEELHAALAEVGFGIADSYRSDGATRDLGVYAVTARSSEVSARGSASG